MKKLKLEELGLLPLSASHLNRFITERPVWLMKKFWNLKTAYNVNMMRGHALEWGVEEKLKGKFQNLRHTIDQKGKIINHPVLQYYDKLVRDNDFVGDKVTKLRTGLPEMVNAAVDKLNEYGTLISAQDWLKFSVDVEIDGTVHKIPFTGRTDFFMESKEGVRTLVDTKCTSKMPSNASYGNKLQQVLYQRATNFSTDLLYVGWGVVSEKPRVIGPKIKVIPIENDPKVMLRIQQTIIAMEKLLRISDDREILKQIIIPNPDDFMSWNDDETYRLRKEIWGW